MSNTTKSTIKPHDLFAVWRPDEVAECLEGVPSLVYTALWNLVRHYDDKPRSEFNDDFDSRALKNWWDELSTDHQVLLNDLAIAHDKQWDSYKESYLNLDS